MLTNMNIHGNVDVKLVTSRRAPLSPSTLPIRQGKHQLNERGENKEQTERQRGMQSGVMRGDGGEGGGGKWLLASQRELDKSRPRPEAESTHNNSHRSPCRLGHADLS